MILLKLLIAILCAACLLCHAVFWYVVGMDFSGPPADAAIARSTLTSLAFIAVLGSTLLATVTVGLAFRQVGNLWRAIGVAPAVLLLGTFLWQWSGHLSDPRTGAVPHILEVEVRNQGPPVTVISASSSGDGSLSASGQDSFSLGGGQTLKVDFLIFGALDRRFSLLLEGGQSVRFVVPVGPAPEPSEWSTWSPPTAAFGGDLGRVERPLTESLLQIEARFRVIKRSNRKKRDVEPERAERTQVGSLAGSRDSGPRVRADRVSGDCLGVGNDVVISA
ncbi:MAG: hypothetical protein AAGM22_19325 [Acidobacteriota bacterium]